MPYRWTLTNLADLTSVILTKDPIGWDEGVYTINRSDVYKGAFHEYTTSLKFHCLGGGKDFIDNVYQTNDIDGRIDVLAEYDCDGSGTYETLFNGIISLASYKTDGEYTTVSIEKSDLLTKLFSRDEISVDLETTTSIGGEAITGIDTQTIPLHSTLVVFSDEWVIENGYVYSFAEVLLKGDIFTAFNSFNMGLQSSDIDTAVAGAEYTDLTTTVFEKNFIEPIITFNEPGITYPITVSWEINLKGNFLDDETTGGGLRDNIQNSLIMAWGKKNEAVPGSLNISTIYDNSGYSADNFSDDFEIVASGTLTINHGDSIWLSWFLEDEEAGTGIGSSATVVATWTFERSTFKITAPTYYKATEAKSVLVHEAFNQVIDAIADSDNNFESEFYGRTDSQKINYSDDGCGSLIAITNGLNIREFPDKPVFCSFKDLYESMDCLHNIGMGIVDGKVRIEPLSYFFDTGTKIISLPLVNNIETSNDNKRYFNKIDIGYEKWESEFHGGLDDPNAKHEYATIIASVRNTYTRLCKYLTSTYTIEFTRRKNIQILSTEDWRYDNNNFLIALKRAAYGAFAPELYSDSFSSGSGMISLDTAYNLRFTPKRLLLAHLNILTAGLQLINGAIKFVFGEGNTLLSTAKDTTIYGGQCQEDYTGHELGENDDIEWNDANALNIEPLWLPEIYSFEYPLSYSEFKTIKANPYGYIEFYKKEGEIKKGFILNMGYRMKTGLTKFQLLKANV